MIKLAKSILGSSRDAILLVCGGLWYAITSKTWPSSYQAMVRLFCRTGGSSNDSMAGVIRLLDSGVRPPVPRGSLGVTGRDQLDRIVEQIKTDGYFVFGERLSDKTCDALTAFASSVPASVRPAKGEAAGKRMEVYRRDRPLAIRYDLEADAILNLPDVQELMSDPTVLGVASNYLRSTPIADVVSMWWHTAHSDQPDEDAAQFFHFDMDRIKWLKFFIYLTDVGPDSGAHCFVRGSHRTGGIPSELRSRGYARLTDQEVLRHFSQQDIIEFHGLRGTVIAEDTRGLHKGLPVRRGDRLMLQIQFSNSLFGGYYPRAFFRSMQPALQDMVKAYPQIYKNYVRGGGV